jgi:hypothetical protein
MKPSISAAAVSCLLALTAVPCHAIDAARALDANVTKIDLANSVLGLKFETQTGPRTEEVDASAAKALLGKLHPADQVRVLLEPGKLRKVTGLSLVSVYADWPTRWMALVAAFALLGGLAMLATRGQVLKLLISADNRYSTSQTQFALWTAMALSTYLATLFLRVWAGGLDYLGGVQITQNLLTLSGLSAISFGAAKAVTVNKLAAAGLPAKPRAGAPRLLDLVQNDAGDPDLGDFQMIAITLLAVSIYFWSAFHFLGSIALARTVSLPDVDTALLTAFGLSQGAYLAKKAALPVGKG